MRKIVIESLESRRLLSAAMLTPPAATPVPGAAALTPGDVQTILAQAISQSENSAGVSTEMAVVVDREGTVLGMLASQGAIADGIAPQVLFDATARARTAAMFESDGEAFTTRTARFIIQNHFPPGINNAAGGPLYGVEFSSLIGSDILLPSQVPAISGDPGGIPLYIHGVAVGGIGVAGDFHDVAATADFVNLTQDNSQVASLDNHLYNANPKGRVFQSSEQPDRDEAVALAGAKGFMAPPAIRANNIFVGGLRLPFTAEAPAHGRPQLTFQQLITGGAATEFTSAGATFAPVVATATAIVPGEPEMENYSFDGVSGLIRDRSNIEMSDMPGVPLLDSGGATIPHTDPQDSDGLIGSPDPNGLSLSDVETVITQAVAQAKATRAGIRKPNGVSAEVHVVVVDTSGNVLGAFRMNDGTNFSYDVAVQKARTAAFFSDDQHAFTTRAIGFMAQRYFPPGITSGVRGPLYQLQNNLDEQPANPLTLKPSIPPSLADGITIFPGGIPLYKNGVLVGAVGVSGDGVDQDDLIAFGGSKGFQPAPQIRSDELSTADATNFILSKVQSLQSLLGYDAVSQAKKSLDKVLPNLRLPYVKLPRNPHV